MIEINSFPAWCGKHRAAQAKAMGMTLGRCLTSLSPTPAANDRDRRQNRKRRPAAGACMRHRGLQGLLRRRQRRAPLEAEEVDILEREYEAYRPYMTPEGIEAVERQGRRHGRGRDGTTVPLVKRRRVRLYLRENGITLCAVEKAWLEKTAFANRSHAIASDPAQPAVFERHGRVELPPLVGARRASGRKRNLGPVGQLRSRSCDASARNLQGAAKPPRNYQTNRLRTALKIAAAYGVTYREPQAAENRFAARRGLSPRGAAVDSIAALRLRLAIPRIESISPTTS